MGLKPQGPCLWLASSCGRPPYLLFVRMTLIPRGWSMWPSLAEVLGHLEKCDLDKIQEGSSDGHLNPETKNTKTLRVLVGFGWWWQMRNWSTISFLDYSQLFLIMANVLSREKFVLHVFKNILTDFVTKETLLSSNAFREKRAQRENVLEIAWFIFFFFGKGKQEKQFFSTVQSISSKDFPMFQWWNALCIHNSNLTISSHYLNEKLECVNNLETFT